MKLNLHSPQTLKKKLSLSQNTPSSFTLSFGEDAQWGSEVGVVVGKVVPQIQNYFGPTLQSMIEKNYALSILINYLDLYEL